LGIAGPVRFVDMFKKNGRPLGKAVVEFFDEEAASKAMEEFNDKVFMGRELHIREDQMGARAENTTANYLPGTAVNISNLPKGITWKDLKELFSDSGYVIRAIIHAKYDKNNPRFALRDKGTVIFDTADEAEKAVSDVNGITYRGNALKVDIAE
jgi:RNA recognition motif-containing protein